MQISHGSGLAPERESIRGRLEAGGWGAFFLWLGIALWADLGWGIGLLGVGAITLATQLLRRHYKLRMEGFWLVVGGLFALGGIWELSGTTVPFIPVLFVIAGIVLLYAALATRMHERTAD